MGKNAKKSDVAGITALLAELDVKDGGRLKVCQDLLRQYVPGEPVPPSIRQCRAALRPVCVNIWDHVNGKGRVLSPAELKCVKRSDPFPRDEAKRVETLRCLLR